MKKIISLFLALVMVVAMVPTMAFATVENVGADTDTLNYVIGAKALAGTVQTDYATTVFGSKNMCYVSWLPKTKSATNAALDPNKTAGYELYLRESTAYQSGVDLRENAIESTFIVGKNTVVGSTEISEYNNFKIPIRIKVPRDGTYKLSLINNYPFDSINKTYKEGKRATGAFTKGAYVKVRFARALEESQSGSYFSATNAVDYANKALEEKDYANNWWYDATKLGEVQQYDDELELSAGEYYVVFEVCEEGTKKNDAAPHATLNNMMQMFYLSEITLTPVIEEVTESEEERAMKDAIAEEVTEEGLSDSSYVNVITASVDSEDTVFVQSVDKIEATRGEIVTVEADTIEGYDFLYWRSGIGRDSMVITNNSKCTVKAVPGTWLTAVYKATDAEKVSVLFYNADGDIIKNELADKETAITFPNEPDAPAGCGEFIGWALNTKENIVTSANAIGNSMVFVAQYSDLTEKDIVIKVPSGATGGGSYAYGDEVNVTAAEYDNESRVFIYWKKGDEIVSFDNKYTFNAFENCELAAVYADKKPITEVLRKIIIKGNVAEFIGLDAAVEKGVIFRDIDETSVTLGNATHKIAMLTDGNHLAFDNDLEGDGATNYTGYAILANGNVIYDK